MLFSWPSLKGKVLELEFSTISGLGSNNVLDRDEPREHAKQPVD